MFDSDNWNHYSVKFGIECFYKQKWTFQIAGDYVMMLNVGLCVLFNKRVCSLL